MSPEQICRNNGIEWMERLDFFGTPKIFPFNDPAKDLDEWHRLEARASEYEGRWIVFDPSDGEEGWLLVGDDLHAILKETADRFTDME